MKETSRQRVERLIKKYGVSARESFSQNFLIDDNKIDLIIDSIPFDKVDTIVEIGPGLGSLTRRLVETNKEVVAVDVDRDMVNVLNNEFKDCQNISVIQGDFLEYDLKKFHVKQLAYVGNLPYNITTKLIKKVVFEPNFTSFNFMVEKGVVEKLLYKKGNVSNTALGVLMALRGQLNIVTDLGPSCFLPAPRITSTFLKYTLEDESYDRASFDVLEKLFKTPRKNIMNNIKKSDLNITKEDLENIGVDPLKRPHELELEEFKKILALVK